MPSYSFLGVTVYIPDLDEIINAVTGPITRYVSDAVYSLQVTMTPLFQSIEASLGGVVSSVINEVTIFFKDPLNYVQLKLDAVGVGLSAIGPQIQANFNSTLVNLTTLGNSIVTDLGTRVDSVAFTVGGAIDGLGPILLGALDAANVTLTAAFEGGLNIVGTTMGGLFSGFGMVDLDAAVGSTQSITSAMGALLESGAAAFSPVTPSEAHAKTLHWRNAQRDYWYQLYISALAIEGASLGQVDGQTTMLFQEPQTRASLDLATSWYAAPYEIGIRPALERFYLSLYTPNIPPYPDVISIYVKEGYLAEKWVELPDEFVSNMRELGYSLFWTQRLWGKHWVLPAVTQIYDMYHRTLGTRPEIGVTLETLRTMLKYHDFEPAWRDRLEAITWRTWRIYDLRVGWEMGILSDGDLEARSIDTGYSPEEAPLVAEVQKMFVLRSEIEKLLTEADMDFIDGWISEATLRANYAATPYRPDIQEMRIARAILRRDREAKKDIAAALKERAIKLDLTLDEYATELSKLGMVEDWISIEQEKVKARLLKKPAAA